MTWRVTFALPYNEGNNFESVVPGSGGGGRGVGGAPGTLGANSPQEPPRQVLVRRIEGDFDRAGA